MTTSLSLLLVEDDEDLARAWQRVFKREGWSCDTSFTLASARRRLGLKAYDVVLLDIKLPDGEGQKLLPAILRQRVRPGVLVLSGSYQAEHALLLLGKCDAFVPKPVPNGVLLSLVRQVAALDRSGRPRSPLAEFAGLFDLSETETELVRIALTGGGMREASDLLDCSVSSVTTIWKRIFTKVGCRSQREVLAALLRFAMAAPPEADWPKAAP